MCLAISKRSNFLKDAALSGKSSGANQAQRPAWYSSVATLRTFAGCLGPSKCGAFCKALLFSSSSSEPETRLRLADPSSTMSGL